MPLNQDYSALTGIVISFKKFLFTGVVLYLGGIISNPAGTQAFIDYFFASYAVAGIPLAPILLTIIMTFIGFILNYVKMNYPELIEIVMPRVLEARRT